MNPGIIEGEELEVRTWIDGGHTFVQKEHNESYPGRKMVDGGLAIGIVPDGICINGVYGTNPSKEEMREMLTVMRECVRRWDVLYGDADGN